MTPDNLSLLAIPLAALYLAALACIYRILLSYRTAQGAIAWIIALVGLPYIAVPLFVLFGRSRFGGYVKARRMGDQSLTPCWTSSRSRPRRSPTPATNISAMSCRCCAS